MLTVPSYASAARLPRLDAVAGVIHAQNVASLEPAGCGLNTSIGVSPPKHLHQGPGIPEKQYIRNQDPGDGGGNGSEKCTGHYMVADIKWCSSDCVVIWYYADSRRSTWATGYQSLGPAECDPECKNETSCTHED
jgi:hypothetical protein